MQAVAEDLNSCNVRFSFIIVVLTETKWGKIVGRVAQSV
jgi:hypothetical protein